MTGRRWRSGVFSGFVAGLLLGFSLKVAQWLTGVGVYTLLLNIDFIPALPSFFSTESVQFLLHLLVSCVIGIIVSLFRFHFATLKAIWPYVFSLIASLTYFPLLALAKHTIITSQITAMILWFTAHLLYALLLHGCLWLCERNKTI
ncbi:hypothetical protein A374_12845 [Fictibacillus macauensis ZFHKF-1]|uniref:Uncharacterized protein n=1 Tax=Fictibacillus macauensis ZFHKF-1 TaxID=1196324 RepID=I8AHL3_9BACL|nr:hypothetical protein [Fictibacillus macauensis]EIT84934.1 hypothetical protein A374_12845 [Fictibacillus macauensis ZFHKF-1]